MTAPIGAFTGVASNLDTRAIVDAIIASERRPAALLETQIRTLTSRKTAWGTYRGILNELTTAARALRTGSAFDARTTTVSGTAAGGRPLFSASANATAAPGEYGVEVRFLARAGTGSTAARPSTPASILNGQTSATLTLNGADITIDATNDSLEGLRDAINGTTAANATAYVIQTGAGASLVVKAKNFGANSLAFSDPSGSGVLTALGWTADAGADATVAVDGVTVTRSSNTISDVIPGITLNLTAAEIGTTATVRVTRDQSAAKTAIESFVTAYNKLVDFQRSQTPSGIAGAARPPLSSEASLSGNGRVISSLLQDSFAGGSAAAQTLSQAGVQLGRDGRLSFTSATYDALAATDDTAVRALFADRMGAAVRFLDETLQTTSGTLAVETQTIDRQVTRMQGRVLDIDDRLARRREALTRNFVAMEAALSRIRNQSNAVAGQLASLSTFSNSA